MADDTEILSVRFEADVSNLKAAAAEAKKATADWEKTSEKHLGRAAKSFRSLDMAAGGAFSLVATGFAATFSVAAVARIADATSRIEDMATSVGLTTTRYQELSNAVRLAGVQQASFDTAVTFFSQQMGDLRRNTGAFYDFLRQSLPTVLEQVQATRSQGEAFDVVAEAVRRLTDSESRAVLVREAFGRGSNELTGALKGGVAGLEQAVRSAGRYAVVSEESIANTKRLADAFEEMSIRGSASLQELLGVIAGPMASALDGLQARFDKLRENPFASDPIFGGILGSALNKRNGTTTGWEPRTTTGDGKSLDLPKFTDTKALDEIKKLQTQLASARGDIFSQIEAEASQSLSVIEKFQQQKLLAEGDYVEARALIEATAEAKRVEVRKQTEDQLQSLQVSALEANNRHFEALKAQYELEEQTYREMLDKKLISEEQFAEARENLQAVANRKMLEDTAAAYTDMGNRIDSTLSAITSAVSSESSKQFKITKAASIATALLKAGESITSAFAAGSAIGGPPVGFAYAAMAAAATAAQIMALRNVGQNSNGSPSVSGGGGSSSRSSSGGSSGGASSGSNESALGITLVGRNYDREQIRELIEWINDAIGDGARLISVKG